MRRIILYTICLFIMAISLPNISPISHAAPIKAESRKSGNTEDIWHILIQARFKTLTHINQALAIFKKDLPDRVKELSADISIIKKEFKSIVTLAKMSKTHPIETSLLRSFLAETYQSITQSMTPFKSSMNTIQADFKELLQLIQIDELLESHEDQSAKLLDYLKQLEITQQNILQTKQMLDTLLIPAQTLESNITSFAMTIEKSMPPLWKVYYKKPAGQLFHPKSWHNFFDQLDSIENTFQMRLGSEIPQNSRAWMALFLRMLLASSVFFFLYLFKRFLSARPETVFTNGTLRICNHSLFWLCVSFVFYAATWSNDNLTYYSFFILAIFSLCFAQMALAWDICAFTYPDIARRSMLWPLFMPPIIGSLLLFLDMPPVLVTCIWLIVLISIFSIVYNQKKDIYLFTLPRTLLFGYMPFLCLMGVISLFGWTRLAVVLCAVYVGIGIFLQQSVNMIALSELIAKVLPSKGFRGIFFGTILGLLVPALLIFFMLFSIVWLAPLPGNKYLLKNLTLLVFQVGENTFSLLQIFLIISAFFITRSCIHVGRSFLATLPAHTARFNSDLITPLQVSLTYSLWGLFVLYTLNTLGFSLTNLAVILGGLSVGIGFGLQHIINNFLSGLLVIFGQNLRENDVIEVSSDFFETASILGVVKKINIRSTVVETFDNATIFIPNAELISGKLINWTRNGRMIRRKIFVGVAYGTDIQKVILLLQKIVHDNPSVLKHPEAKVRFRDFSNNRLNFTLGIWVADITGASAIEAQIAMEIEKVFRENDITIES